MGQIGSELGKKEWHKPLFSLSQAAEIIIFSAAQAKAPSLDRLIVIQGNNAPNGTVNNPNPGYRDHTDTEDGTAQSHTGKQVWIIACEKQEKERYKGNHIPEQIPPKTADLP